MFGSREALGAPATAPGGPPGGVHGRMAAAPRPQAPQRDGREQEGWAEVGVADGEAVGGGPEEPTEGSPVSGRLMAALLVIATVVVAVVGYAWLDLHGQRPLPGTPLAIGTAAPLPSGSACGRDVLPPARLQVAGERLILVAAQGGTEIPVAWPAGYAARDVGGRGGLYDPSGFLVAQDGESIQGRFFGSPAPDGTFLVCRVARD